MVGAAPPNQYGTARRPAGSSPAAPPGDRAPRCATHPQALAAWRCGRHGELCPDCAAENRKGATVVVVCAHCGAHAPPIMVSRASDSFASRIPRALAYPANLHGLLALAGLGLITGFLPKMGFLGGIIAFGIYWSYMFSLVEQSACGSSEIEAPDYTSVWDDILAPAVRGLLATSVIWVPAVVLLVFTLQLGLGAAAFWGPMVLVILAGVIYAPMAVLIAATRNPLRQMLNPVFVIASIGRLGTDYAIAVGALVALGIAQGVVKLLATAIDRLPIPLVSTWVAATIALYLPFVMARILGLLLYVRGVDVGFAGQGDDLEPVLPNAQPRGTPRAVPDLGFGPVRTGAAAPPAAPPPAAAPSAGPVAATAAPPPAAPVAAVALPPSPEEVTAAVAAGDLDTALARWRGLEASEHALLAPAVHVAVGRHAVAVEDYHVAVRALRAGADAAPDDAEAQRAWVLLARVYADRLGDHGRARQIYGYVVERYPGTSAAEFAQGQLAAAAAD